MTHALTWKRLIFKSTAFCIALASTTIWASDKSTQVIKTQNKNIDQAQKYQKKIDRLSDETKALLSDYKATNIEIENLKIYNKQLEKIIAAQLEESTSIQKQIKSIETTNQRIVPLMVKMVDALKEFIELDTPFLQEERKKRLNRLEANLNSSNLSVSEKYRTILEAYQIENEYGRSIESYTAKTSIDGTLANVEFLRIGRIALIFRTLDGNAAKYWDAPSKSWQPLDSSYYQDIRNGISMAKKQAAPNLLTLPIKAPEAI